MCFDDATYLARRVNFQRTGRHGIVSDDLSLIARNPCTSEKQSRSNVPGGWRLSRGAPTVVGNSTEQPIEVVLSSKHIHEPV